MIKDAGRHQGRRFFKNGYALFQLLRGPDHDQRKIHDLSAAAAPSGKRDHAKDYDPARPIQVVTEEIMLKMAGHAHEPTQSENLRRRRRGAQLCNGRILRKGSLKRSDPAGSRRCRRRWARPLAWYQYLVIRRGSDGVHDRQKGSLLGPDCVAEIEDFVKNLMWFARR